MKPVSRGYEAVRQSRALQFCKRSAVRICKTLFWRKEVIGRLPVQVLYYWYELRSRVLPWVSDANPLDLRWVDPDDIEYYHSGPPMKFGHVKDGDWDAQERPFNECTVYKAIQQCYQKDRFWEETSYHTDLKEDIKAGKAPRGLETVGELDAFFDQLDVLADTLKEEGYRTQRELLRENPGHTFDSNNDAIHPVLHEIGVNIYRDGSMAKKRAGNHRMALAKVLGLEEIPVAVRVRHAEWQAIRDEIREADSPEELSERATEHLSHPDMKDIVPEEWK